MKILKIKEYRILLCWILCNTVFSYMLSLISLTCWQLTYSQGSLDNRCPYDYFWPVTIAFPFGLFLVNVLGWGLFGFINLLGVILAMYKNNYWYLLISSPIFVIYGLLWPFGVVGLSMQ